MTWHIPLPLLARTHGRVHLFDSPCPKGLSGTHGVPSLILGRMHEICGPARRTLALAIAGRLSGPVFWIAPAWTGCDLDPEGINALTDPGRLIFIKCGGSDVSLWCAEESLRAGIVPLVVVDLLSPPALTPVRRMHLAAEAGAAVSGTAPLGLILTPQGAAQGIETRWALTPRHHEIMRPFDGYSGAWRLERLLARMLPPATWILGAGRHGLTSPE